MINLIATLYEGTAKGTIDYNVSQLRTNANLTINNLNTAKFSYAMSGVLIPMTGTASAICNISFKGATLKAQLQSLSGSTTFNVKQGEIKDFIK